MFEPTPIKVWWVGLVLVSTVLKLGLVVRLVRLYHQHQYPLPCFGLYLLAATAASIIRGDKWSMAGEIILALMGVAFVSETLWIVNCLIQQPGWAKIFAWAVGALVAITILHAAPEPYPGYAHSLFYLRLYSTAVFLGASLGAAALSLTKLKRQPFLLHNLIMIPWFAATLWGLFGRALGVDRWDVRITSTIIWIVCLSAWHLSVIPPLNGRVQFPLKVHQGV